MSESDGPKRPFPYQAIFCVIVILVVVATPEFLRARARDHLIGCKSNMKNIGTAMEMYSTDWDGKYPPRGKAQLTPKYLESIPECPAAGTDTYVMSMGVDGLYNTQSYQDFYFMYCSGDHHKRASVPMNYPQYNGIVSISER